MILSKRSLTLVLDLIEDRIHQLDPLVPQNARDPEVLIRCREEIKVTAIAARLVNAEAEVKMNWQGRAEAYHPRPTSMDLSLDVI